MLDHPIEIVIARSHDARTAHPARDPLHLRVALHVRRALDALRTLRLRARYARYAFFAQHARSVRYALFALYLLFGLAALLGCGGLAQVGDTVTASVDVPTDTGPTSPADPADIGVDLGDGDRGDNGDNGDNGDDTVAYDGPLPFLLVHGFGGFDRIGPIECFFDVEDTFAEAGIVAVAPQLPPLSPSTDRARALADAVDALLATSGAPKIHLIAHSQGGLDVRRLVSALGYADRVASVTTVGTPYHGTPVADAFTAAPDGLMDPLGRFMAWMMGASESPDAALPSADAWDPALAAAVDSLTTTAAEQFLVDNPWPAGVPLFTVAGISGREHAIDHDACAGGLWSLEDRVDLLHPSFWSISPLISLSGDGTLVNPVPSDGLVPTASAHAPEEIFLGCIPADHLDEVGHIIDSGPSVVSHFDHRAFYLRLADNARTVE